MFLSFPAPPSFKVKTPANFCWWLLTHLSPLYWFSNKGVYSYKKKVKQKPGTYAVNNGSFVTSATLHYASYSDRRTLTDRRTDRQSSRQTDTPIGRQTDGGTKRKTRRETSFFNLTLFLCSLLTYLPIRLSQGEG